MKHDVQIEVTEMTVAPGLPQQPMNEAEVGEKLDQAVAQALPGFLVVGGKNETDAPALFTVNVPISSEAAWHVARAFHFFFILGTAPREESIRVYAMVMGWQIKV